MKINAILLETISFISAEYLSKYEGIKKSDHFWAQKEYWITQEINLQE